MVFARYGTGKHKISMGVVLLMEQTRDYELDIGPIRPPNEGGAGSLLLRITRNCHWNRCSFCPFYTGEEFGIRDTEEIKGDIDKVKKIGDMLEDESEKLHNVPYHSRSIVHGWLRSGARTVFLQDSDSLVMPSDKLIDILVYLKEMFPTIERITSYTRSDTLARKDPGELRDIREAGLTRLHVGLESGSDRVLELVNKGVTAGVHVEGGTKALEAGFQLSEYVIPGLGGREHWEDHALETARVLNLIDPDFIRMRPLVVNPFTELHQLRTSGEFTVTSPHERLREIRLMVEELNVSSALCFDHFLNGWRGKNGSPLFHTSFAGYRLPGDKELVLGLIEEGLQVDESMHLDMRKTNITSL